MDFITGILGLAVLSGPLWLIVLAVPAAFTLGEAQSMRGSRNYSARRMAA